MVAIVSLGCVRKHCPDRSWNFRKCYFIKRFDRTGRQGTRAVEDFAQLLGYTRDTKYSSLMKEVVKVIKRHCTFPVVECVKLFSRTLFSFLCGNEDMHLKYFSLIIRDNKIELSPAYDLVNTTIVLGSWDLGPGT